MQEFFVRQVGNVREDGEMYEVCVFDNGVERVLRTIEGGAGRANSVRDYEARIAGVAELTTPSLQMQRWMDAGGRGASVVMQVK